MNVFIIANHKRAVVLYCYTSHAGHTKKSIMEKSAESLSDESSDICESTYPEYSTSSESSGEEATPDYSKAKLPP